MRCRDCQRCPERAVVYVAGSSDNNVVDLTTLAVTGRSDTRKARMGQPGLSGIRSFEAIEYARLNPGRRGSTLRCTLTVK